MFLSSFVAQSVSAPKLFEELLISLERLGRVQIEMSMLTRGRKEEAYSVGPCWTIKLENRRRFVVNSAEMWGGDSGTFTSDGKTLLVKGEAIILRNAPNSIGELGGAFESGGPYGSVLFQLFKGRSHAETILGPAGRVETIVGGIRIWSRSFGVLDVTLVRESGYLLPTKIVSTDKASKMANYLLFPMFSDKPETPSDVFSMSYTFVDSFPRNTFDTRVKKGTPVMDQRKKP